MQFGGLPQERVTHERVVAPHLHRDEAEYCMNSLQNFHGLVDGTVV